MNLKEILHKSIEVNMANSYKNTSSGAGHKKRLQIGENKQPSPPSGGSSNYERTLMSMDAKDNAAMNRGHYSKEKLKNY